MGLSVTSVRRAEPGDLESVQAVEEAADQRFGEVMDSSDWGSAPSGEERARRGTLLVIGQPVLGFAHVVELDHGHHLEALAVHPDAQRRGLGTTLLRAAYGVVSDEGGEHLTLTTFEHVPWNAPWYARHGFTVLPDPVPGPLAEIREREGRGGLDDGGPRVAMVRRIEDTPTPIPAVSVLPIREGAGGLEVFVQHRVATMDFVPGAVVFPGGRIDPGDAEAGARLTLTDALLDEHTRAWADTATDRLGGGTAASRTLLATALREVAEETGAELDPAHLIPWDDWETPIGGPKRFDVRFFLLPVRDPVLADAFRHTTTEAHLSEWTPVRAILTGVEDGSLVLVAPTRVLVEELATFATVEDAASLRPRIERVRHDLCPSPARRHRWRR